MSSDLIKSSGPLDASDEKVRRALNLRNQFFGSEEASSDFDVDEALEFTNLTLYPNAPATTYPDFFGHERATAKALFRTIHAVTNTILITYSGRETHLGQNVIVGTGAIGQALLFGSTADTNVQVDREGVSEVFLERGNDFSREDRAFVRDAIRRTFVGTFLPRSDED